MAPRSNRRLLSLHLPYHNRAYSQACRDKTIATWLRPWHVCSVFGLTDVSSAAVPNLLPEAIAIYRSIFDACFLPIAQRAVLAPANRPVLPRHFACCNGEINMRHIPAAIHFWLGL